MLDNLIKTADFKSEKHVPVMDIVNKEGDFITVGVTVGKEIAHPNTTEHFINYISLFYVAEGESMARQAGKIEFTAHGESAAGANEGPLFTEAVGVFKIKATKPGKLIAVSYCNIHGLWQSEMNI